jgi:hypothetical protein
MVFALVQSGLKKDLTLPCISMGLKCSLRPLEGKEKASQRDSFVEVGLFANSEFSSNQIQTFRLLVYIQLFGMVCKVDKI